MVICVLRGGRQLHGVLALATNCSLFVPFIVRWWSLRVGNRRLLHSSGGGGEVEVEASIQLLHNDYI